MSITIRDAYAPINGDKTVFKFESGVIQILDDNGGAIRYR